MATISIGMKDNSRTNKFLKNIAGSALLQVVTIVTGFISPVLMLHAFGSEVNGITMSILRFISYITLVEAGLGSATTYALYKPLAERNNAERDAIISASKISYFRVGYLFIGLSIVLAIIYPFIGSSNELSSLELSILVLVLCLSGVMNFFILAKYRSILSADQCGYIVSFASAMQLIASIAIVYITIKLGCSVIVVRTAAVCSMFITTVILKVAIRRRYKDLNFKATPNMKALNRRYDAMANQIFGVITYGAPVIILTSMSNFKELSVYAVYGMIAGSLTTCLNVFTSGLAASFGNVKASENEQRTKELVSEFMTAFFLVLTVLFTTAVITIVPFVDIYTKGITDVNYHVPLFGFLIVLSGFIEDMRIPQGMMVQSFGKFKVIKKFTCMQAIIAVSSSIAFIKLWNLDGAMIALCITHLYMLIAFLRIGREHLSMMSLRHNLLQLFIVTFIFLGFYFLSQILHFAPSNYGSWVVYAVIVFSIVALVSLGIFWLIDRDNMKKLNNRFQQKFKNRN